MSTLALQQNIDRIKQTLSTLRIPAIPGEYDLHNIINHTFAAAGIPARHEVKLAPRCRIDFWVDGIGIEVKKGRPNRISLIEQCRRYLSAPEVEALILVVERSAFLPNQLCGKPVHVFELNRLWGVALP